MLPIPQRTHVDDSCEYPAVLVSVPYDSYSSSTSVAGLGYSGWRYLV